MKTTETACVSDELCRLEEEEEGEREGEGEEEEGEGEEEEVEGEEEEEEEEEEEGGATNREFRQFAYKLKCVLDHLATLSIRIVSVEALEYS